MIKETVSKYSCGDKVRAELNKGFYVFFIQNSGTSTISWEVKRYEGFFSSPSNIAGVVGGIVGALVLIGVGVFFYRRHKAQKLAEQLGHHAALV